MPRLANRHSVRFAILSWLVAGVWALACGHDPVVPQPPNPPPPPPPPGVNREPSARMEAPAEALEGYVLAFGAGGSSDPDGDALSFAWDFGDGVTLAATSDSSVVHAYRDNGAYVATLIASDGRGGSDTARATVDVKNVAPRVTLVRMPEFAVGGGIPAYIEVRYSDPGLDDTLRASISFSLSGRMVRHSPLHGPGISTQTFLDPGKYGVRVTVEDGEATTQYDAAQTLDIVGRYEMMELGTLGGPGTLPIALNDSGYVVGCSGTGAGDPHAFRWRYGNMIDLAPGAGESCAHTITNSGLVGGILRTGTERHVVTWTTAGALTDFGTCCGIAGEIVALTNSELVVGGWDGHSFILEDGVTRSLGGLSDSGAVAKAMNNRRQIVGASRVAEYGINRIDHAFIWENGVMRDLGLLGDPLCPDSLTRCGWASAVRINNDGVVIGTSTDAAGEVRGVRWINDRIEDLGFPSPKALNSQGDVAGNGPYPVGGEGFFWRNGVTRSIGSLGGGTTFVADMNDAGIVVASSYTSSHSMHVAVWNPTDGRLVDLGIGPPIAGGTGAQAIAINARGDVLGLTVGQCLEAIADPNYRCIQYDGPKRAVVWRKKA